jgi:photosystem II stability/assembly factor-like uncharacterized protein
MGDSVGVSDDRGRTWHWGCDNAPYLTRRLIPVDDANAWAWSEGLPPKVQDRAPTIELVRTDDAGRTWRSAKLPFAGVTDVDFVDRNFGWVLGGDSSKLRLVRTTDGDTWQEVEIPSDSEGGFGGSISFADRDHGWMSTGNPSRLYRTSDGGRSWSNVQFPDQLSVYDLISPAPQRVIVGTGHFYQSGVTPEPHNQEGLMFSTADGGATWTRTAFADGVISCCNAAMSAASPTDIAVMDGTGVTISNDGGRTWTASHQSADGVPPSGLAAEGPRRFLVSLGDGGEAELTDDAGRNWQRLQLPYRERRPGS